MNTKSKIESILFIAAKPMSINDLAKILELDEKEVRQACEELKQDYTERKGGIVIIKDSAKYQMVSAPDNAKVVKEFVKQEVTGELSKPSLETLTIIAYRGPIAKLELDRIRGINCSLILRNLLIKGLIEAKTEKTETYYSVTTDFLKFLGITETKELPDYEQLSQDQTINKVLDDNLDL
ncbi:MAG: SMC-Scp complex subunit ScpB [bacterium]